MEKVTKPIETPAQHASLVRNSGKGVSEDSQAVAEEYTGARADSIISSSSAGPSEILTTGCSRDRRRVRQSRVSSDKRHGKSCSYNWISNSMAGVFLSREALKPGILPAGGR